MNTEQVQSFLTRAEQEQLSIEPVVLEALQYYELILHAIKMDDDTGYLYVEDELVVRTVSKEKDIKDVTESWTETVCKWTDSI